MVKSDTMLKEYYKNILSLFLDKQSIKQITIAIALFQPYTAIGKLKADITPITPKGFHLSNKTCPGRSDGRNAPAIVLESPTA